MKTVKAISVSVVVLGLLFMAQGLAVGKLGFGGGGEKKLLTLADVEPKLAVLAGTTLDPFAKEKVEYGVMGDAKYDDVCRNSAIVHGSLKVAQTMLADAQENLGKYAKDHASRGEAKQTMEELKGKPETEWTPADNARAIKEAKKSKGKFTKDEIKWFGTMSVNLALASAALAKGIESAAQLSQQIPNLLTSAKSDFSGPTNALKLKAVIGNLNLARTQIQDVPTEGKKTAKDLAIYIEILKVYKGITPVD